jgi:hypothetical protein
MSETATTEQKKFTPVTDKQLDQVTNAVGAALAKQKKKTARLYLATEERQKLQAAIDAGKQVQWPFETVNINGYTFQIQRGEEVEVPESVYEILLQANLI